VRSISSAVSPRSGGAWTPSAKSDLVKEWDDVARRMPDYLADREREEGARFVGIASDGLRWAVFELAGGDLAKLKETQLDPEKPDLFLAWLDGAVALKKELPPDRSPFVSSSGKIRLPIAAPQLLFRGSGRG
jgi:hypothetical protein